MGNVLCQNCQTDIERFDVQHCAGCFKPCNEMGLTCIRCRQSDFPLDGLLCGGMYTETGVLGKMIRALKYDQCREIVPFLGNVMIANIPQRCLWKKSVLVSIPLSRRKMLLRGFNQAFMLAEYVACRLGIPVCSDFLLRLDNDGGSQTLSVDRKSRFEQIASMFYLNSKYHLPSNTRCVILVDDVYTSGATLCEAARTVKQRFPDMKVQGMVAARTV